MEKKKNMLSTPLFTVLTPLSRIAYIQHTDKRHTSHLTACIHVQCDKTCIKKNHINYV